MFITELDTFLQKFHQLWSAGQSAHLDLETHAGNAWAGLGIQLEHVPGHLHPHFPHVTGGVLGVLLQDKRMLKEHQL